MQGNEHLEKAMRQEKKLLKAAAELEQRRRDQAQLEMELKEKQDVKLALK